MSRYIDAEAYEKDMHDFQTSLNEWYKEAEDEDIKHRAESAIITLVEAKLRLKKQPTVDAVPVVHCKDCKKYAREEWKRKLDEPHNFADTEWKMEFSGCMGFDDPEKGYCYAGERE